MKYRWENRKQMADVRVVGLWGHAGFFLGAIFAVLGIIGDAANVTLGLEPTSWLLLAIAVFVASIPFYMGLGLAWYLRNAEAKSVKKE
ncbi:MAG: hypothetical protein JW732_09450 [Dehalococcoidia bacterium]|nr:hypothetical protein [Dehalococcoidia bacterium]